MDLTGTEITIISGLFIFESSDVSSINLTQELSEGEFLTCLFQ